MPKTIMQQAKIGLDDPADKGACHRGFLHLDMFLCPNHLHGTKKHAKTVKKHQETQHFTTILHVWS